MKRLFHLLIFFSCTLSVAEGYAQNYPIQVTPVVRGGTDMRWSTFYSDPDKLKVRVVHKDKDVGTVGIFFKIKIERAGISIRSREDLMPPQVEAINMNFGTILDFTGVKLYDYFRPENLMVQGLPPEFLYQGGTLPDGFYMVSVTAYEYDAARGHRQVSNTGISSFAVFKGLPPIIQFPKDGQVFTEMAVQNVLFQWLPRTFSAPDAGGLSYKVELFMIDQGTNPQEATNSTQAIFTAMTSGTSLPYGPGYPGFVPLQAGKQYALRVQVVSTDAGQQFANDGKSQVVSFSYGHSCVPPVNVSMAASDNFWDKLSWTPVAGAESYRVRFTSRVTGITDSTEVYGSYYDLYNPNRRDTLTYSIVSLCSGGRRSSEVAAERPTERNLRTLKNEEEKNLTQFNVNSESANPFDRLVSTSGVSDSDIERELNRIKNPYDEIQRPCNSDKVTSTDCDPATITPTAGTENFILAPQKYMYINGYEILITSPNEGLLYLPLIQSRIPVYWEGALTVKKASPEDDYGCIMDGEVKMQGSVTGAIGRDLHRQVMALLTQGPGQWSGKLGDSFDAFEKIILEIEQAENPTQDQLKKFQNIGIKVIEAIDTWKPMLERLSVNNSAAASLMNQLEEYKNAIQITASKNSITKDEAIAHKDPATGMKTAYNKAGVLQKVLEAVKTALLNKQQNIDLTDIMSEVITSDNQAIIGVTMPVFLDGSYYYPDSYTYTKGGFGRIVLNLSDLDINADKTQIGGLFLKGGSADIEGIWNWLATAYDPATTNLNSYAEVRKLIDYAKKTGNANIITLANELEEKALLSEKAQLANLVYGTNTQNQNWIRPQVPSELINVISERQGQGGFYAELYESTSDPKKQILAFRGTNDFTGDILANLAQGLGYMQAQYEYARDIAEVIKNKGYDVEIVGHSLGGGLASLAGAITGKPTTTFNPAGLHQNTATAVGVTNFEASKASVTAYINVNDVLNLVQDNREAFLLNLPSPLSNLALHRDALPRAYCGARIPINTGTASYFAAHSMNLLETYFIDQAKEKGRELINALK